MNDQDPNSSDALQDPPGVSSAPGPQWSDAETMLPYRQDPGSVQPHWPPPATGSDPASLPGNSGQSWGTASPTPQASSPGWYEPGSTGFESPSGYGTSPGYGGPLGHGQPSGYQGPGYGQPGYGQPGYGFAPGQGPSGRYGVRRMHRLAVASLVLGILSVTFGFIFILPPILAIVFGGIALPRAQYRNGALQGRPLAVAGLVLGIVTLAAAIALYSYVEVSGTTPRTHHNSLRARPAAVVSATGAPRLGPRGLP